MDLKQPELFMCDCHSPDHVMFVDINSEDFVSVHIHLNPNRSFFERLMVSFRYLFGLKGNYPYAFEEILLNSERVEDLQKTLRQWKIDHMSIPTTDDEFDDEDEENLPDSI